MKIGTDIFMEMLKYCVIKRGSSFFLAEAEKRQYIISFDSVLWNNLRARNFTDATLFELSLRKTLEGK